MPLDPVASLALHSSWSSACPPHAVSAPCYRCCCTAAAVATHQIGPCHAAAASQSWAPRVASQLPPVVPHLAIFLHLVRLWTNFASTSPESKSSRHGFIKKTACLISPVVFRQIRQHRVSCGSQASRRRWYLRRDQRRYPPSANVNLSNSGLVSSLLCDVLTRHCPSATPSGV